MSERVTVDASALVAMLVDGGPAGTWAAGILGAAGQLLAPHLAPFEVSNILRRQAMAHRISPDQAAQAHADLLDLQIELWPYQLLGPRTWSLRANLSAYDASYVALAELTGSTLVTLDGRLSRAPGLACDVLAAPGVSG